ncbi:hypothetical protein [uncultured Maribacter sp.]|uniref:hypothetical protein n=1 Tax=uncultured Maribacter sp. TaxID=431308 RepID=UPI00261A3FFE|nr:hypothetical protein [uncultured Maribacter sp.]
MEQAKRVAKNTGFLYARMAITVFISLYSTRLVLAALGATDFGIFNVVAGAIAMLTFLNAAMTSATQRFMSFAEGKGDFKAQIGIFNVSVLLHWVIAFIVVLILEIASYFLFNGILEIPDNRLYAAKLIFQCMVISTFFKIISVPYDAVINAHENMFFVAVLGVLESLLKLGIAIYITSTNFDALVVYGFLMALMEVILLLIRRVYCHKSYKEVSINIKKHYDRALFKEMSSFAGWSFLGSSTTMFSQYGQGVVLNMFFGPKINASHGIANQISGQMGAFATTMLKALSPAITKSEGAGGRSNMLKMTLFGSKFSFFLLIIFTVPVIIEMPYIFKFWLINVPPYAILFSRLILFNKLIEQLFVPIDTAIRAVGHIKEYQIAISILAILPLPICAFLFSYNFSPYYLYVVLMVYVISHAIIILFYARKYCSLSMISFFKQTFLRSFFTFLVVIGLSYLPTLLLSEGLPRLITVIIISGITYLFSVWYIGFNKGERQLIIPLLDNTLKKVKNIF